MAGTQVVVIPKVRALLLIMLSLFVGYYSLAELSFGALSRPGSGMWPFLVAVGIGIAGVVMFFRDREPDVENVFTVRSWIPAAGLLTFALLVVALPYTGLVLPALLVTGFWFRVLGRESWTMSITMAVVCSFGMYYLFVTWLGVRLPDDILWSIFA